ncbi:uncharacterized protein LOC125069986 isoform X1 [Vanessa atalanta]|uniref:uncharacterized protein LOC125069986 isoform X1 n=1 Tax=Vanessa atalanta TaxID=42275 RepID=UPI001FCD6835|nr:uncharacterized protein LOC125069986 isoform X1 [Vanessa atalanta]
MDKSAYETYEYLPSNSTDNDANQFFVVQDDGTFLSVNRPVQYLTQVEDVKEVLDGTQPCAVYDVTPQQFYVDVDNSAELISVSDQFVIPEGESNMYANSYLLQAVENDKEEQMDQDNVDEENKEISEANESATLEDVDENTESKNDDCTEITLSDEQYQLLEKKGWILLEISEKIFLLDNMGLHDITEEEKLIEKLKQEIQADNNEEALASSIKTENGDVSYENSEIVYEKLENEQSAEELVNYVIEDEGVDNENSQDTSSYYDHEQDKSRPEIIYEEELTENGHLTSAQSPHDYVRLNSVKNTSVRRDSNALRIKTSFSFKDIPPQIVLGRTIHGKKLVASVKTEKAYNTSRTSKQSNSLKTGQDSQQLQPCNTGLDETKFDNLIQEALCGNAEKCSMKDVTAAEIVVEQLLRVPAFKPTVMERRLLITKVVIQEYEQSGQMYVETIPTLVTGQVVKNGPKIGFMYLPDMLRMSLEDEENDDLNQRNRDADDENFLHIHIREMKGVDGITRISITLNKRHIPLREMSDVNIRQKLVYACSACAAVYKTEEGLRLHQETECMETDDMLTIDAENSNNSYTIVNSGKDKQYMCNQCHSLFTKLNNCLKHIKTHFEQEEVDDGSEITPNHSKKFLKGVFKCKMCPSTYFHASTLSKHIVSKHIKIKTK